MESSTSGDHPRAHWLETGRRWWEVEDRAPLPHMLHNAMGGFILKVVPLYAWRTEGMIDRPHP